jgi:predicted chitinase
MKIPKKTTNKWKLLLDKEQLAYVLATPYHEAFNYQKGIRFGAMTEMGGTAYLRSKPYYPFYGRGPSHLTWKYNYEKEAKRTGLDLVKNPDLMLDVKIGSESHVYCMLHGIYTGKKLSDYINDKKVDFVGARHIINGTDQDTLIAGYATEFLKCIITEAV